MDVSSLIKTMHINGIDLHAENDSLRVNSVLPLGDDQRQYLKQHKTDILQYLTHLEAANQSRRYTYRFTLKHNQGGGTYITDCPPAQAKQELLTMFVGREVETISLLN